MLWGRGGDGDKSDGEGVGTGTEAVGMGTVFTGSGGNGVQFLSPCRPPVVGIRLGSLQIP